MSSKTPAKVADRSARHGDAEDRCCVVPIHSLDKTIAFLDNNSKMAVAKKTKSMQEIALALAATKDSQYILRFLNSLLTPNEIDEISSRWELVKLLNQGHSQRQIAQQLGLSLCKITRGSRELKKKDSPFKLMIDKLNIKSRHRPAAGKYRKPSSSY